MLQFDAELERTWLDETVPDSSLFIPNYHIIRRDRNRHGGGLLLYIHDDIPSTCLHRHATLELLTVELRLQRGPLSIVLYYRPPSSVPTFDDLEDALVPLTSSQLKSCILLGDFNVDLLVNNQLTNDLTTMLSSFHFTQVVSEPTRLSKNSVSLIDHVYLTDPSLLSSCSTSPPLGTSDHRSIMLSLNRLKCPPPSIHHRIWNYSRADWDTICADLENLPTPTEDVDSSWAA